MAGEGWVGELVAGDVVRDAALQPLRVLSVELDSTPTRVHNLEVAGAHTYFTGELEAWGHNSGLGGNPFAGKQWWEIIQIFEERGFTPCSSKRMKGSRIRSEWISPKGTKFFLDDTGEHPGLGDHVDVWKQCKSNKKRKAL